MLCASITSSGLFRSAWQCWPSWRDHLCERRSRQLWYSRGKRVSWPTRPTRSQRLSRKTRKRRPTWYDLICLGEYLHTHVPDHTPPRHVQSPLLARWKERVSGISWHCCYHGSVHGERSGQKKMHTVIHQTGWSQKIMLCEALLISILEHPLILGALWLGEICKFARGGVNPSRKLQLSCIARQLWEAMKVISSTLMALYFQQISGTCKEYRV